MLQDVGSGLGNLGGDGGSERVPAEHGEPRADPNLLGQISTGFLTKIERFNHLSRADGWEVQVDQDSPQTSRGLEQVAQGAEVIVGISLNNSYFSPSCIDCLVHFLSTLDRKIYLAVMNLPAEHNYRALGFAEHKLAAEIRKKSNAVCNKLQVALARPEIKRDNFELVDWQAIRGSKIYQENLVQVTELYSNNPEFRAETNAAVAGYLSSKSSAKAADPGALEVAAKYILEELAFLQSSSELLNTSQLVYLYHRSWPIYERYISGEFACVVVNSLPGFLQVSIEEI